MTELSFAKSFLTTLDKMPERVSVDYAVDLKTFEPTGPYTLPRMPKAMRKPGGNDNTGAPGSTLVLGVVLKSAKNPPLDLRLAKQPLTTSILDLKQKVADEIGLNATNKVRILYQKKPCSDSKTVKEIFSSGGSDHIPTDIEFSVMIIGGITPRKEEDTTMTDAPTAVGPSGEDLMQSQEFWNDLEGFLQQRIKDANVAKRAALLFEKTWKDRSNP